MYEFGDKYGNNKFKYNQANISGVSIVHYGEVIPRENREKMTHDVCFRFCRTDHPGYDVLWHQERERLLLRALLQGHGRRLRRLRRGLRRRSDRDRCGN
ncbi:unnamed protein product [Prorocentrum cordatum]|uniref:Transmembrane 9 superfamily member n=1 Tax=Prorocentrum cordatum TaxID=2364126 RepID=A0ABN9W600_9DINO|nr:unnamed protein product [Polarella glacialis]